MSNESAPKSLVKLASLTTSFSSTPNLSTIIAFTLDAMSDIIFVFYIYNIVMAAKIKKLYFNLTISVENLQSVIK